MARDELRGLTPSRVRPAAAPVDTYVRPGPSRIEQLASALGELAGGVSKVTLQRDALRREQDKEKAIVEFSRLQGEYRTWKDVIKDNPDLESESPFFRYLMEQQLGEAAGKRAGDRVMDSIYNGALGVMDADFDEVAGGLIDKELEGVEDTSEAFRLGLAKQSEQELGRARSTFRDRQSQLRFQAGNEGFVASVERVLWDRPDNLAANIDALIIRGINANMDPSRLNDLTLTAIRNVAIQTKDPTLFQVIDELPTKGGYVGDIPSINAKRRQYIEEVNQAITRENNRADAAKRREDTIVAEQVNSEIWRRTAQDPNADISDQLAILGSRGMRADYETAARFRQTVLEGGVAQDSPYVRQSLLGRVYDQYNPLTARELVRRVSDGQLGQGDFDYLMRYVNARNTALRADSPNKATYTKWQNEAGELAKLRIGTLFDMASAGVDAVLEENARSEMRLYTDTHQEELDAMEPEMRNNTLRIEMNRIVALERARAIRTDTSDLQNTPYSDINKTVAQRVAEHSERQIFVENEVMSLIPAIDKFMLEAPKGDQVRQDSLYRQLPAGIKLWFDTQLAGYAATFGGEDNVLSVYETARYGDEIFLDLFFMVHGQENYYRFKESR